MAENVNCSIKRMVGHPPIISSVEELERLADTYFKECLESGEPITVTGLAISLGLSSRQSLLNYQGRAEYVDAVKKAKLRCEHFAEIQAHNAKNPAGPIFCLKNFGWSDKQEHTLSGPDNGPIKLDGSFEIVLKRPADTE